MSNSSTRQSSTNTSAQISPSCAPNSLVILGVVACFILSGFAALLYQTAWMRQFSLVFGTSELAIAAVLSAYMAGLALGASIAAKYVNRITRPVLFYGLLEAGIALSALAVPFLLKGASFLYIAILGNQPEPVDASGLGQSFFYLSVAFIVLAIPTAFMGATLPLLTKYIVQSKDQIGTRVGLLYASNTAGAIGGTLTAGFVLLPLLGLNGTVAVGVLINLLVFVLAALIAKAIASQSLVDSSAALVNANNLNDDTPLTEQKTLRRNWILPVMLVSGANSFLYEVLWTRLLGHVLGGSITAFSTMLAGFLGGIAIGSAIASRFAKTKSQASKLFIVMQCGIALTSILIYYLLPTLIPKGTAGLQNNVMLAIMVLLPATLCIGATFPLAVRIFALDENDAGAASARIYSWNTVGAIVGATVAAFFLIPMLKYEGAIKFAVVINMLLAVATAFLAAKEIDRRAAQRWLLITGLMLIGILLIYKPTMPEAVLRSSPVYALQTGDIRYYEVGRSATVVVIEDNGSFNIRTNGLPEATTNSKGAPPSQQNQRMLSVMPVLAQPDTKSLLVVGLGGGVALERVPKSVKSIDVIELEPQVVKANISIGDQRVFDPLKDPRVNVIINDARSALTLTNKRYDAIVSQPSHPWTAGASHLYTREFMALARDHLTERGVYLQWMNTQFVDEFLLRSLNATMLDVFPHVRIYQWNSEVLFFLGSDHPLNPEQVMLATGRPVYDDTLGYLESAVGSTEDLVAALAMDQVNAQAMAQGGQIITDNNNIMATHSAKVMESGKPLYADRLERFLSPYDPLLQAGSDIRQNMDEQLNYSYISRRLRRMGMRARAIAITASLRDGDNPAAYAMIGLRQQLEASRIESQKNLLKALMLDSDNQQARYSLLLPWFDDIAQSKVLSESVQEQLPLLTGTARATLDAWLAREQNDWQEVALLDAQLNEVLPSDLWYELSVKLRSDWRVNVDTPSLKVRLANEALQLIDAAAAFSQDAELYTTRIKAAFIIGDVDTVLETIRWLNYVNLNKIDASYDDYSSMAESEMQLILSQSATASDILSELQQDSNVSGVKLAELTKEINRITGDIRALPEYRAV